LLIHLPLLKGGFKQLKKLAPSLNSLYSMSRRYCPLNIFAVTLRLQQI